MPSHSRSLLVSFVLFLSQPAFPISTLLSLISLSHVEPPPYIVSFPRTLLLSCLHGMAGSPPESNKTYKQVKPRRLTCPCLLTWWLRNSGGLVYQRMGMEIVCYFVILNLCHLKCGGKNFKPTLAQTKLE